VTHREYIQMNPIPNDIIVDWGGFGTARYYYTDIDNRPCMHRSGVA
jgi:hypothetical protein